MTKRKNVVKMGNWSGSKENDNQRGGNSMKRKMFLAVVFLMLTVVSLSKVFGEEKGLVGYWKLDGGTIAKDSSDKSNDGELKGNPEWVEGISRKALQFKGTNDYVNCGNDPSLNITNAITIKAWVKLVYSDAFQTIISKGCADEAGYRIGVARIDYTYPNSPFVQIGDTNGNFATCYAESINLSENVWTYVVGVKDAGALYIYANGNLENTCDASSIGSLTNSQSLTIGCKKNSEGRKWEYCNGTIDEVKIYNRALSANEIENHYYKMGGIQLVKEVPNKKKGEKAIASRPQYCRKAGKGLKIVTCDKSEIVNVAVNPTRYFHGPARCICPNGDWLVTYQDSISHSGMGAYISQARSKDQGRTWHVEGILHNEWDTNHVGCRNPAMGVMPDGKGIVLVIQRWDPTLRSKSQNMVGSIYFTSTDNGKTYQFCGFVDKDDPWRHLGTSSPIITINDTLYMLAFSWEGITLYTSNDNAETWKYKGLVFSLKDDGFSYITYGSLIQRPNGDLIAQGISGKGKNYQRVSKDLGRTWGSIRKCEGLGIRNNTDLEYVKDIMVAHGRAVPGIQKPAQVAAYFSLDYGTSWGCPITLEEYGPGTSDGGYSASFPLKDNGLFIVFSSNVLNSKKPDLRGVYLKNIKVGRIDDSWYDRHIGEIDINLKNGQTVSGKIQLIATIVKRILANSIDFYIDGEKKWTEKAPPYVFNGDPNFWDTTKLADGEHMVKVVANYSITEGKSLTRSREIMIKVKNK